MPAVRMSLKDAAAQLSIAPNSVRSRWKSGKIRGERDNHDRVWVFVEPGMPSNLRTPSKPSAEARSKPSTEGSKDGEINALQAHVGTLTEQLVAATVEIAQLRPRAAEADRLEARLEGKEKEIAILEQWNGELKGDRDRLLAERRAGRSWLARMFG